MINSITMTGKEKEKDIQQGPTIYPHETDIGTFEATNLERYQDQEGNVLVVFNLTLNNEPITPDESNEPIIWRFWIETDDRLNQDLELGLAFENTPTISTPETENEFSVERIDPQWIIDGIENGTLTPIQ